MLRVNRSISEEAKGKNKQKYQVLHVYAFGWCVMFVTVKHRNVTSVGMCGGGKVVYVGEEYTVYRE